MSYNPQIKKLKDMKPPIYDYGKKKVSQEPIKQTHCANCGAPLNPAKSRCEYCKSYCAQNTECYILESL